VEEPPGPVQPSPERKPPAHLDAVADIEASGPSAPRWSEELSSYSDAWQSQLAPALAAKVRFERPACFQKGCLVRLKLDDLDAYRDINHSLSIQRPFRAWSDTSALVGPNKAENGTWTGVVVVASRGHASSPPR
jgi:hypothetical protein